MAPDHLHPYVFVADWKQDFLRHSFNNAFFLKLLQEIGILSEHDQELKSYYRAPGCLINALLAHSVSLGGRPCVGGFAVVPCSFHLLMMDWKVFCETLKA